MAIVLCALDPNQVASATQFEVLLGEPAQRLIILSEIDTANSAAGIRALLQACGPDAILVFEATSGCDRRLLDACAGAGRPSCG